jgi:hypothetical protein
VRFAPGDIVRHVGSYGPDATRARVLSVEEALDEDESMITVTYTRQGENRVNTVSAGRLVKLLEAS